jgi:hypothetical protein
MRTIGGVPRRRLMCGNSFRVSAIYCLSDAMEEAKHGVLLKSLRSARNGKEYEAVCSLCPRIAKGVLRRHFLVTPETKAPSPKL